MGTRVCGRPKNTGRQASASDHMRHPSTANVELVSKRSRRPCVVHTRRQPRALPKGQVRGGRLDARHARPARAQPRPRTSAEQAAATTSKITGKHKRRPRYAPPTSNAPLSRPAMAGVPSTIGRRGHSIGAADNRKRDRESKRTRSSRTRTCTQRQPREREVNLYTGHTHHGTSPGGQHRSNVSKRPDKHRRRQRHTPQAHLSRRPGLMAVARVTVSQAR
jgi:hypothetical protein